MPPDARQTGPSRITSLDALRGVGILGILAVHIQWFASVAAARFNPTVYGDVHGANWWVWLGIYVLADGKFVSIFGMLFGAGIVILAARAPGRAATTRLHYRRMAGLFILGLLHAYVLWYGDFLVPFAICGSVAFLYCDLPPRRLAVFGILLLAVGATLPLTLSAPLSWWPGNVAQEYWAPSREAVAWEINRYRSGWWGQMPHRAPMALMLETFHLAVRGLWQGTGLMLLGMALFKLGVFSAGRPVKAYAAVIAIGFGIGIPMIVYGVLHSSTHHWALNDYILVGDQLNYWGALFVALGWIGTVLLFCRRGRDLRAFSAIGRTALSNYLMQSLVCTTLFYGHGLGLFGHVDRVGQLTVVVAIWLVEVAASRLWLRYFLAGPIEWLWRSTTYGRWLQFRLQRLPIVNHDDAEQARRSPVGPVP